MIWLISIHILLALASYGLCIYAKEKQWGLAISISLIPFIGPCIIIWAFVYYLIIKEQNNV